ncbi:hypothetical protein R3398_17185 [Rossellomorea marisflavi]|uniref:hypothetical protein n=1 Tax=Rossellomorea marisflavi TaxID=189381 RepID=UPI00296FD364|nr:hypothetical protein [Rossellomorea marisflavi]MDW4528103.1 hypothetical protein [Rossellomorea marisflavi]
MSEMRDAKVRNIKTTISFVIKKAVLEITFLTFVYFLGVRLKPNIITFKNDYFLILFYIIILVILINWIRYGRSLYSAFRRRDFINNMIHESLDPTKEIKQGIASAEIYLDVNKERLNLIKTFSPLPILIFVLGLFFDNKSKVVFTEDFINNFFNMGSFTLKLSSSFMLFSFTFTVLYFIKVGSVWARYKSTSSYLEELRMKLIYLESQEYSDKLVRGKAK